MDADLADLMHRGVVVIVASRDEHRRVEIARAWAPEVAPDWSAATVCVGAARDSRMIANLGANGAIAVTAGLPTSYRMIQLKGRVTALAEPTPEQLARVESHLAAFAEEVRRLGISEEQCRRLLHRELCSVALDVRERYDQTPGPRAGARV